ncbi:MAG: PBSX family phage terminase large subunit [Ruminococcus sp.]|nr:PBSX family phage terminase large subunit [Ruminococcus sp.]
MMFSDFSPKQLKSMMWWQMPETKNYDAIVCDGSVRSGKTLSMTIGFVLWSCACFDGENFALCGKTIDSLKRNVVTPMQKWIEGIAKTKINFSRNYCDITIENNTNRFYFFGGKDESSYQLIQGLTLAGVLFDEAALMPRSFVEQALARCSVSGSKFWFNCNPDSPEHWFYNEWVDENSEKVMKKNRLRLHFTMDDNYSLDPKVKKRYERMYTGVFYERYILGLWVIAQGLVYTQWSDSYVIDKFTPPKWCEWHISMDYGTINPCSMGLWCVTDDVAVRVDEYYYDSRREGVSRTDEEHYAELEKLAAKVTELCPDDDVQTVVIDPSAASFIECIRRHQKFNVRKADNDVLNGIRRTSTLISLQKIRVMSCCKGFLKEVKMYRWAENSSVDGVIKENDHAMDDTRYLVNTVLKNTILRNIGGE